MAFKVDFRGKTRHDDSRDKFCNHYNRVSHDEETCYQLHGFPKWWDPSRKGARGSCRTGSRGGRPGHGGVEVLAIIAIREEVTIAAALARG